MNTVPLVSLVGAGPGAADLITVRGLRRVQAAEVVLHDALIGGELLRDLTTHVTVIDVGKTASHHRYRQDEINELLVSFGRLGKRVVRLKGGDPLLFGRGGEEAAALREAGIPFEIIPGVSSVLAAAAEANIPLTHREASSSVSILTAERGLGRGETAPGWKDLAIGDTLVVLMGARSAKTVFQRLLDIGKSGETPAAILGNVSSPNHWIQTGTIASFAAELTERGVPAPAIIIVGEVVRHQVG